MLLRFPLIIGVELTNLGTACSFESRHEPLASFSSPIISSGADSVDFEALGFVYWYYEKEDSSYVSYSL